MAKSKGKSNSGKMTSLDVMTILGWVIGIGLIIFGIVFSMPPKQNGTPEENAKAMAEYKAVDLGKILSFIDYPSV
ncbi:MAG: hypothetical protein RR879_05830, partial [Hydrogenoanaerobacterium sp.]